MSDRARAPIAKNARQTQNPAASGLLLRAAVNPQPVHDAPPTVHEALNSPGQPLDPATRGFMEERFEHDFSHVRLHAGPAAERSARGVHAKAYTVGNDIVFGPGRLAPGTNEGRRLIAHELTHVVQAEAAAAIPALPSGSVAALEREARHAAHAVVRGHAVAPVLGAARGLMAPLREDLDDPGVPTFGNLPQEEPDPQGMRTRVVLVEEDGLWYEKRPDGKKWRAQGSYDFVVQGGKILAVKGSGRVGGLNPGHTEAASGGRVEYAGQVRFGSSKKARGTVQQWSNASGHYAPVSYFAKAAGLPMDKFKPEKGGFPDKGPQLAVFQPKKGDTFVPRSDAKPAEGTDSPSVSQVAPVPVTGAGTTAKDKLLQPPTPGPIEEPPPWVAAKKPVTPTAPAAVVSTDDPRTVGKLYSPNLVQEYRTYQLLYQFSSAALDNLEAKEAGGRLSDEDQMAKAMLTAQIAAAQARMLQARKDHEMLDSPATTPQQLQEMLGRRGIAIPAVAQTNTTGAATLKEADISGWLVPKFFPDGKVQLVPLKQGSSISAWSLDDKGFTKKSGTATTQTTIDSQGMPVTRTKEASSTTNIGFGTASKTTGEKSTEVSGDKTSVTDQQRTKSVDLIKGEGSSSRGTTTEIKDDVAGTSTKTVDKTTYTAGLGGLTRTKEDSTQVGSKLDSTSSTLGLTRTPGQLGLTAGNTTKSGTMIGPPGEEKVEQGQEKTNKLTGGAVSDEKGTGIGGTASQDRKTLFGDGKSVTTAVAGSGRFQALVKEIEGSEPPRFTIMTTISFDVRLGATAGKEWAAKPGAQQDTGLKGSLGLGGGASIGAYASFKRELTLAKAREYVDFIQVNGRGSKLPEHQILATGASQGWDSAKKLWQSMNGSAEMLKNMKPGEELESNVEVGGDVKGTAGGGESRTGGTSVGGEASVKGKHKINVKKTVRPDGKIQVTAVIEDEGELGVGASVGFGVASGKAGKSWTRGEGRTIVFILDPKNPAFSSQLTVIDAAATPADLSRVATMNKDLVATSTEKQVEGEGSSVGAAVGPVSADLGGKGKLTSEMTRDAEGNLVATKVTGENQGGGTFGIGEFKAGDTKTESYVGEVDLKTGKAKGELAESKKSTSVAKTVQNAPGRIANDPLGALLNPGKLIEDEVQSSGTAIADPEIMAFCYAALDVPRWNARVGGHRHDDWVAAGSKIRRALATRGKGREIEIISVDKPAVQQALAGWTKADVEGRKAVLDAIIRPLGGAPGGKAFAFPDGAEGMKTDWDAFVIADPLSRARELLAAKKPQEALAEMRNVKGKVGSLYARVKSASSKWAGLEVQHAEMLGHINSQINEVDTAIRDLAKTIPATSQPDVAAPTSLTTEQVKEQEGRQRADEARADLETYNNNIATMRQYSDTVFAKLGQSEARLNDDSFFSGKKSSRIAEVTPWIKEVEDLLKLWEALYWPTYRIYEKWSAFLNLDKSRLEKLHPAGARGRWLTVYDQTRDKAMAGR